MTRNASASRLYHGSRQQFPVGFVLRPQPEGYVAGSGLDKLELEFHAQTERLIEEAKPEAMLSRNKAVFLSDDVDLIDALGGYSDYIYEVRPVGPVFRCGLHWYSEIAGTLWDEGDQESMKMVRSFAQNYWLAAPNDKRHDAYEFLAGCAVILNILQCAP